MRQSTNNDVTKGRMEADKTAAAADGIAPCCKMEILTKLLLLLMGPPDYDAKTMMQDGEPSTPYFYSVTLLATEMLYFNCNGVIYMALQFTVARPWRLSRELGRNSICSELSVDILRQEGRTEAEEQQIQEPRVRL